MWIVYALLSALFAGITSILTKIGIKDTDSNLATAVRTVIVAVFAWLMVFVVGSQHSLVDIDTSSLIFLILSGLATGASWLCYFRALQIGDINKVVPVDKSSTVITMLLAFFLLNEELTAIKVIAMVLIGSGTMFMLERKKQQAGNTNSRKWLIYAILSALFASLTAILGKVGISSVESNLGTAIRTVVVLIMAWLIVFWQGKQHDLRKIDKRSWLFLGVSGLATGFSWLYYYRALQEGLASVVVPIDKLSILVTIAFGYVILQEKLSKRALCGLVMIVVGTLSLLI